MKKKQKSPTKAKKTPTNPQRKLVEGKYFSLSRISARISREIINWCFGRGNKISTTKIKSLSLWQQDKKTTKVILGNTVHGNQVQVASECRNTCQFK